MSMMRFSTLWAIHGSRTAAEEPGPLAQHIAQRWEHDSGSLRFFRSSANSVYCFDTAGARHFLRFASDVERTRPLIDAEVDLVEWLAAQGAAIARPVPSKTGQLVETVATESGEAGVYHAVVIEELKGAQPEIEHMSPHHFERWGAALGYLHALTAGYAGPALSVRPSWRDHLSAATEFIPAHVTAVRRELDDLTLALEALPAGRDYSGPIHGDFELDNLRWPADDTGPVGMLDFDDCSLHWYAADIAFVLRDLFNPGAGLDHPSVAAFLDGYRTRHPLPDDARDALPLFSRLSRLVSFTTRTRAVALPDSSDHPGWLRGLRRKFENHNAAYVTSLQRNDV